MTSPPGRTIQVPGGTQALRGTERVHIVHEGRHGKVPRPSLPAARQTRTVLASVQSERAREALDSSRNGL
jgi:hypothetical protein